MPKRLILMRHGDYTGDLLTGRGRKQADNVATQMEDRDCVPDLIIHSPVPRAVETAQRVRDVFNRGTGKDIPMVMMEWLTDGACSLPRDVQTLDNNSQTVLAVSHQPNIAVLYTVLSENREDYKPTHCQTCVMEADVESWKDFTHARPIRVFKPGGF